MNCFHKEKKLCIHKINSVLKTTRIVQPRCKMSWIGCWVYDIIWAAKICELVNIFKEKDHWTLAKGAIMTGAVVVGFVYRLGVKYIPITNTGNKYQLQIPITDTSNKYQLQIPVTNTNYQCQLHLKISNIACSSKEIPLPGSLQNWHSLNLFKCHTTVPES